MTTFCLIHGSGQGPEGWKLLVHELEQLGHSVLTPAFHLNRTDEGAAWHADTIVEWLKSSGHAPADGVCVAHSASGMYLPLVAERWRPPRMVTVDANLFLCETSDRRTVSANDLASCTGNLYCLRRGQDHRTSVAAQGCP